MKRCPECRRDYYDDSLSFCLVDGSPLVHGVPSNEPATAILPSLAASDERATKNIDRPESVRSPNVSGNERTSGDRKILRRLLPLGIAALVLTLAVTAYLVFYKPPAPTITGSFRSMDSTAFDYYLRGKIDASSQNRERNQNAIDILQNVVDADAGFAPAYAALSRAYGIKADLFAKDAEQKKLYDDAKLAAEKALAIDPNLAEGHLARGAISWNHINRFPNEQTIQAYKKAIELQPDLEEGHHLLGLVYYHVGLFDKAEQEIQRAIALNPSNSLARFRIGLISAYRTDYEKAFSVLKTVPLEANETVINRAMAGVLFQLGRIEDAEKLVDDFLASTSDEGGNVTSVKAMLLAKSGRRLEAEEAIQRAIELGQSFQHFHHTSYNIASAYALLDESDKALKWLEFTADEGFPCYPLFDKDPNLQTLRKDDRFIELMAKWKHQWERYNATL